MESQIEQILYSLSSKEIKKRLDAIGQLEQYVSTNTIEPQFLGSVLDAIASALTDNNPRVCFGALNSLCEVVGQADHDASSPYMNSLITPVIECMGDAKQNVRDKALEAIVIIAQVQTPAITIEKLKEYKAFKHKNWKVKEMILLSVIRFVREFGPSSFTFSKVLPSVVDLLEDPNARVRETSVEVLQEIYRYVGDELRDDLRKRNIRPTQLKDILEKLNSVEVINNIPLRGTAAVTATEAPSRPHTARSTSSGTLTAAKKKLEIDTSNDSDPDVFPIRVYSDKDLAKAFEQIASSLNNDDWQTRMSAMKKIQGLLYGGATEFSNFMQLLGSVKAPLAKQIVDLRSSIVKEACATISLLSKTLGDGFESLTDYFIVQLFKTTFVTIQVIADSGNACIRTIITNTRLNRSAVQQIIENCAARRNMLRTRCTEYILLLLEVSSTQVLDKHAEQLEQCIKTLLFDALSEVRATARKAVCAFMRHWESRGRRLVSELDSGTQKLIMEEERKYQSGSIPAAMPHRKTQSQPVSPRGVRPHSATNSEAIKAGRPTFGQLSAPPQRGTIPQTPTEDYSFGNTWPLPPNARKDVQSLLEAANLRLAPHIAAQANSSNNGALSPNNITVTNISAMEIDTIEQSLPAPAYSSNNNSNGNTNTSGNNGYLRSISSGGPVRVEAHPSSNQQAPNSARVHGSAPQRVLVETRVSNTGANTSSGSLSSKPQRVQHPASDHSHSRENSRPSSPRGTPRDRDDVSMSNSSSRSTSPRPSSPRGAIKKKADVSENEDLLAIIRRASSAVWTTRLQCFELLKTQFFYSDTRSAEVITVFDKVIAMYLDGLSDTHYKVVQGVLTSMLDLITLYQANFETAFDRVFPKLFLKLTDPKDDIRILASQVLERIGENYVVDTLISVLLRVLDNSNSKIRLACLEYLLHILSGASDYLAVQSHMRLCIAKLHALTVDKRHPDLHKAGIAVLNCLYNTNPEVFLTQLLLLPVSEQLSIKQVLRHSIPDLDAELAVVAKQRRLPSSALTQSAAPVSGPNSTALVRANSFNPPSSPRYDHQSVAQQHSQKPLVRSNTAPNVSPEAIKHQAVATHNGRPVPLFNNFIPTQQQQQQQHQHQQNTWAMSAMVIDDDDDYDPQSRRSNKPVTGPAAQDSAAITRTTSNNNNTVPMSPRNHYNNNNTNGGSSSSINGINSDEFSAVIDKLTKLPGDKRKEYLAKITKISRENDEVLWTQFFGKALFAILENLVVENPKIREMALIVLKEMLRNQREHFEDFVELTLKRILERFTDSSKDVCMAADEALNELANSLDHVRTLEHLSPIMMNEQQNGPVLLASIRLLQKVAQKMPPTALFQHIPAVLPGVYEAFKSPEPDIRKAVVFCLVELYYILGERFRPFLSKLNTSQLKLVTIYINRLKPNNGNSNNNNNIATTNNNNSNNNNNNANTTEPAAPNNNNTSSIPPPLAPAKASSSAFTKSIE